MSPQEVSSLWERFEQMLYAASCAALEAFAAEHASETWYGLIFDCNADYGDILMCLNTESDLAKCISEHYSHYGPAEKERLRWNAGDWTHQGFNRDGKAGKAWDRAWRLFQKETGLELGDLTSELKERLADDPDELDDERGQRVWREVNEQFLTAVCRVLLRMEESGVFTRLKTTADFGTFVNDHDETDSDSWDRLTRIRLEIAPPWKLRNFVIQGHHPGLADAYLSACADRLDAGARDEAAALAAEAFRLDASLARRFFERQGQVARPGSYDVSGTAIRLPVPESYAWACALVSRSQRGSFEISSARYRDLNRALELDPQNVAALAFRAEGYESNAQFADNGGELLALAVADLTEALRLEPDNPELLRRRATVHLHGKCRDYAAAVADLGQAMRTSEPTPGDHTRLGWACQQLEQWDAAIEHYATAVALLAGAPSGIMRGNWRLCRALNELGQCRFLCGRFEEAAKDFTRALELGIDEAELLVRRCLAYDALGRTTEAEADRLRALKKNKKAFEIWGHD
jgi:tetratricopeptide (TPR) repeat protein